MRADEKRRREYPRAPLVGVGGVVVSGDRALLIRRGTEPALGEWTIPGGLVELGETLAEAVVRELREETALTVRVVELIEALERVFYDPAPHVREPDAPGTPPVAGVAPDALGDYPGGDQRRGPRYHYVILDYLCEIASGTAEEARAGSDITDVAWVRETDLASYQVTPATARIMGKAFTLAHSRAKP